MPKKKKNIKELNKKDAIGDLLDAFTEVCRSLSVTIVVLKRLSGFSCINNISEDILHSLKNNWVIITLYLISSCFVCCRSRALSPLLNPRPLRPTQSLLLQLNLQLNLPLRLQMRPGRRKRTSRMQNPTNLKPHLSQLGRNTSTKEVGCG